MYLMFNTGHNSISTHQKLQIAEAYNNLQRLKEEEKLLQIEMKQFISTFKEIIPNELYANIQSIYTYLICFCILIYQFRYTLIDI